MIVMTANKPKSYPFPNVKPLIHATTCLELLKFPPITRNVGKVPGNLSPALLVYSDTLLAFTLSHSPHVLFVFVFSSRSVPPFFHSCCYNSLSHFCYFWTSRSQAALPSLSSIVGSLCLHAGIVILNTKRLLSVWWPSTSLNYWNPEPTGKPSYNILCAIIILQIIVLPSSSI